MAKNFHSNGDVLPFTAAADVESGKGVLLNDTFGVSAGKYANGDEAQMHLVGVWELAKTSANVIAAGAKVYWNNTAKEITSTATGNKLVGIAWEAAGNGDTVILVRLTPYAG